MNRTWMEGAGIGALLTALALVGNPHARETAGPTSPAAASEQYADFPPILLPESAAPMLPGLEAGVAAGRLSPVAAARQVLAAFLDREAEARQSGAPAAAGPQA